MIINKMAKTISATEAAWNCSELLSHIRFRGMQYTHRQGRPACRVTCPATPPMPMTLGPLTVLLKELPSLGDGAKVFAKDIEKGIGKAPGLPKRSAWG